MNKIKNFLCFIKRKHLIKEKFCPYTQNIYQTCLRCNKIGIKNK